MNPAAFILLFLCAFNLTASPITFEKVPEKEISTVQEQLIFFYSQELLRAGLFSDEASALQGAKEEVLQEAIYTPLHLFYLSSADDGARCGYIAYSLKAETAYIESVYLNEEHRGLGLGRETLSLLEKELQANEINVIKLYVFAHNQAAFNLYKKMGYNIENVYFNKDTPIGYHMKKEMNPQPGDFD